MNTIDKKAVLKLIGQNIQTLRKEKNMEVKELAKKIKITPQAIGNIENGKVDLNFSRTIDIANALQVNFEKILNINNGDVLHYTSSNNSGGYHVQKVSSLIINEDKIKLSNNEDLVNLIKKMAAHLNIV